MALLAGFLTLGVLAVGARGIHLIITGDAVPRLQLAPIEEVSVPRSSLIEALLDRQARYLGPRLLRFLGEGRIRKIRHRLDAAGHPSGMTAESFIGRKAAFAFLFLVVGLLALLRGKLLLFLLMAGSGWFWMDAWLLVATRRRQGQIERALPDFLDIVAVTVGAGLGFRAALSRVGDSLGGPLAEEIKTSLRQIELGMGRRDAFQRLRERNDSPTLARFVTALIQAEELGTPLTDALVELSADLRKSGAQEARRKAARAAPRISLVVTTLIVPGAIILMVAGLYVTSNVDFGKIFGKH